MPPKSKNPKIDDFRAQIKYTLEILQNVHLRRHYAEVVSMYAHFPSFEENAHQSQQTKDFYDDLVKKLNFVATSLIGDAGYMITFHLELAQLSFEKYQNVFVDSYVYENAQGHQNLEERWIASKRLISRLSGKILHLFKSLRLHTGKLAVHELYVGPTILSESAPVPKMKTVKSTRSVSISSSLALKRKTRSK